MIQNPNITTTRVSSEPEVDRSILKIIIFALFGAAFGIFSVYLFSGFLGSFDGNLFLVWFPVSLIFFVFVTLQSVFIKSRWRLGSVLFVQGLLPLALFWRELYPNPSALILIAAGVNLLFLITAGLKGQIMAADTFSVRISPVAKQVVPRAIAGMLILLTAVTYTYYFPRKNFTDELGRSAVGEVVRSAQPILNIWFPGVSVAEPVGTFIRDLAIAKLQDTSVDLTQQDGTPTSVSFRFLPERMKQQLIENVAQGIQSSILQATGGRISMDETVEDATYNALREAVTGASEELKTAGGIAIAVLFFFILKGLFSLFYWLIALLSFLFFKFLIVVGFAYLSAEDRTREFALFS